VIYTKTAQGTQTEINLGRHVPEARLRLNQTNCFTWSDVRIPVGTRGFCLLWKDQTGSGAHPASYGVLSRE